jgi:hypothetical protein
MRPVRTTTPATRRLLLAGLSLAAAALACARAEVPIVPGGLSIATPQVLPPTATEPPLELATATSELAEGTRGASTSTATEPPPTATAPVTFASVPLQNGTFDTDLSGWNLTPNWTLWQDGYARLNAAQAGPGAVLVQITNVPQASEVRLAFSARSEDARGGECIIRSHLDTLLTLPADGEWHPLEVDFTLAAGTQTAVNLQARNNSHCEWVNIDDVHWLVPAEPGSVADATATPGEASEATATVEPSATPPPATATLSAIPANAIFTQDFTVSAVGDSPVGAPADLRDGQTITWASLRNGTGAWVFNLGSVSTVAGLRVVAHRDGDQDTTIVGIDVSADGAAWTEVYRPGGTCGGTANCQVIDQGTPVELPVTASQAQYVRVRSGPTRFALAEVEVAVVGN